MTSYQDSSNRALPPTLTTGSLPIASGNGLTCLSAGLSGQVLTSDPTKSLGVNWSTPPVPVISNYLSQSNPNWLNSRQAILQNYCAADSTNSAYLQSNQSTLIDFTTFGVNGGIMQSQPLPGSIQVVRNQISGTNTSFTTTFQVGDVLYLPQYNQSRKISSVTNNTEMTTDSGDNFSFCEWTVSAGSPIFTSAQSKFGGYSLQLAGSASVDMAFFGGTNSIHQTEFTQEALFYLQSLPASSSTNANLMNGQLAYTYNISVNSAGKCLLSLSSNGTSYDIASAVAGTTSLVTSTWYHLALTYLNGQYTLWLNGAAEIVVKSSLLLTASAFNQLRLGASEGTAAAFMTGFVQEERFSGCCRYQTAFTPPSTAFATDVYTLSLNHLSGFTNSSNFNAQEVQRPSTVRWDNTFFGSPTLSSTQSKFGGMSYFTGGTSAVICNTGLASTQVLGSFTIEMFLYPTALSVSTGNNFLDSALGSNICGVSITTVGKVKAVFGTSTTAASVTLLGTASVAAGSWTHIALTYDGATYRMFTNGVLDASMSSSTYPTTGFARQLILGTSAAKTTPYTGYIDNFRFSNQSRYQGSSFTVPTSSYTVDSYTVALNTFDGAVSGTNYIQDGEQVGGLSYCRGGLSRQTHYYSYAVGSSTASQLMLSTRCQSSGDQLVDLPAGATLFRQLRHSYLINVHGNLPKFSVFDKSVIYSQIDDAITASIGFSSDFSVLSYGAATAFSTISCQTLIPKTSKIAQMGISLVSSSAKICQTRVRVTGDLQPSGVSVAQVNIGSSTAQAGQNDALVPLSQNQQFDYLLTATSTTNSSFCVKGYQITEV